MNYADKLVSRRSLDNFSLNSVANKQTNDYLFVEATIKRANIFDNKSLNSVTHGQMFDTKTKGNSAVFYRLFPLSVRDRARLVKYERHARNRRRGREKKVSSVYTGSHEPVPKLKKDLGYRGYRDSAPSRLSIDFTVSAGLLKSKRR